MLQCTVVLCHCTDVLLCVCRNIFLAVVQGLTQAYAIVYYYDKSLNEALCDSKFCCGCKILGLPQPADPAIFRGTEFGVLRRPERARREVRSGAGGLMLSYLG